MLLLDDEDTDGLIETAIILKSLRPVVSSNDDVTLPAGVFDVLLSKNIAPDLDWRVEPELVRVSPSVVEHEPKAATQQLSATVVTFTLTEPVATELAEFVASG